MSSSFEFSKSSNIFCEIASDEFDIEIKKSNKKLNLKNIYQNKQECFFRYVINYPIVKDISHFLYHKINTEKEKEIINNINAICDEVDYKYKRKMIKFILIIASIIICFSVFSYISTKKKLDLINYVSLLNERYFKDGYFIYINSDIISIFYLKEDYRINADIKTINELNEKFMKKYDINF